MGASQSVQLAEEDDEEAEEEDDHVANERRELSDENLVKKILEQEPEMLPCHASASPLSPQLSSLGTPRIGPSIKVWDPYNVLAPPPPLPPPPQFPRSFASDAADDGRMVTEVYLISHGECRMSLRPDLVAGRCPEAEMTPNGKRQARALAVFLKSQGVRFNAVYVSPLDRARATALSVCQEMNFSEEQIQPSDALVEMSQGQWEGWQQSEIYTPEMLSLMDRSQPDFSAPSGESLRQVEFRMVEFLYATILGLPEKLSQNGLGDNPPPPLPFNRHNRQGLYRKKSGKSRLQYVTHHEADDEMSPPPPHLDVKTSTVGVFTHSLPIKCLLTGVLGCNTAMYYKICIEDSSVTVLQHSWKTGWQIKRMNDTAHLRLL